jgi:hypothetical protein
MATIDQIGYRKITKNEEAAKEVIGYQGIVQFQATAAAGGRIMSSLAGSGGLAAKGGIAGQGGGLAG